MIIDGSQYSERQIVNILTQDIRNADTDNFYTGGAIGSSARTSDELTYNSIRAQRAEAYRLYYLQSPGYEVKADGKTPDGSAYVSGDVYDAVESMKQLLLDTFQANKEAVQLKPEGAPDVEQMDAWVDYVMRKACHNEGWMHATFHEALLAKAAAVRVYVDETPETERITEVLPAKMVSMLAQIPQVEIQSVQPVGPGAVQVEALITRPKNQLVLDTIAPEDFLILGESIKTWDYIGHIDRPTVQELKEFGLDDEQIKELPDFTDTHVTGSARWERHRVDNTTPFRSTRQEHQYGTGDLQLKQVHHSFRKLDIDGDGQIEIIYCIHGYNSSSVIHMEVVEDHWYEACIPHLLPHKFYGHGHADLLAWSQYSRSHLIRQILDNVLTSNRGRRTEFGINAFENPDEGRAGAEELGATVPVRVPGQSYFTEPHFPLPQETIPVMEMLAQDKEQRSGLTRTAQGMNPDAVAKQNAQDMVLAYADMGQRRPAMVARQICETFIVPLIKRIVSLTIANAKVFDGQQIPADDGGETMAIQPSQWRDELVVNIATALTPDEQMRSAAEWLQIDQYLSQSAPQYYLEQNKVYVLQQWLKLLGKNADQVLSMPGTPEHMRAAQAAAQASHEEKQKAEAMFMAQFQTAQAQVAKLQSDAQMNVLKTMIETQVKQDAQDLDEEQFEWEQTTDLFDQQMKREELELEAEQERPVSITG